MLYFYLVLALTPPKSRFIWKGSILNVLRRTDSKFSLTSGCWQRLINVTFEPYGKKATVTIYTYSAVLYDKQGGLNVQYFIIWYVTSYKAALNEPNLKKKVF